MSRLDDVSGLQVAQDLELQRAEWRIQRVAWVVIGLVLAAAVLGVFGGGGPLAATSFEADDGTLEVDFDRFARLGAQTSVEIELRGGGEGARDVAISRAWLDDLELETLLPEPESVTALADRYVFTVDVGRSGRMRLIVIPGEIGRHRAVVWGPDGSRVEFVQIVYP